jgi:hypothetical protein
MSNPVVDSNMRGQRTGCHNGTVVKKCNAAEILAHFKLKRNERIKNILFARQD